MGLLGLDASEKNGVERLVSNERSISCDVKGAGYRVGSEGRLECNEEERVVRQSVGVDEDDDAGSRK